MARRTRRGSAQPPLRSRRGVALLTLLMVLAIFAWSAPDALHHNPAPPPVESRPPGPPAEPPVAVPPSGDQKEPPPDPAPRCPYSVRPTSPPAGSAGQAHSMGRGRGRSSRRCDSR